MKKTLSHICVLLPLAMVLAACEPETRVVEKQVEVEVSRPRMTHQLQPQLGRRKWRRSPHLEQTSPFWDQPPLRMAKAQPH